MPKVDAETIELDGGIIYLNNKDLPFTGVVFSDHPNGETGIEMNIVDGRVKGKVTTYRANGKR